MVIVTIFDIETSGLPVRPSTYKRYGNPFTETNKYDSSRIVEIGYVTYECPDGYGYGTPDLVEQRSSLVKPESFMITNHAIHGISHKLATERGNNILDVLSQFMIVVSYSDIIVSHNIEFDKNITCSEMVRCGMVTSAKQFMQKKFECTMILAMHTFNLTRFPKLKDLYESVCESGVEWKQNHRAMDDALRAADCFFAIKMSKNKKSN
jgi:DNA polymerase-3 subunit alpha